MWRPWAILSTTRTAVHLLLVGGATTFRHPGYQTLVDDTSMSMQELRSEVQSVMRTQGELDGVVDEKLMAAFSERVAAIVAARLRELEAERQVAEQDVRERNQVRALTGLASLAIGIPTTAILWHTDGPPASAFMWLAIILVNVVAYVRTWPRG